MVGTGASHLDSSTQHPPRAQDVAPECHTSGRVACLVIRFTSCLYNHFAGRGRKERGGDDSSPKTQGGDCTPSRPTNCHRLPVHGLPVFEDASLDFEKRPQPLDDPRGQKGRDEARKGVRTDATLPLQARARSRLIAAVN